MRANVALIGFRRPPPSCRGDDFTPLPDSVLFTRELAQFRWIVIGDAAIDGLDPRRAASALDTLRDRVIICVDACKPTVLAAWFDAGFAHVRGTEALAPFVARPHAPRARPLAQTAAWLGCEPEPGSRGAEAIAAIAVVQPLSVGSWASHLGWSDRKLFDVCRSALGMRPSEVLTRIRVHLARLASEECRSVQGCAEAAEWRSASTLRRARDRLNVARQPRPRVDGESPT